MGGEREGEVLLTGRTSLNIDSLAVVLFAYNERGNLLRLLKRLESTLDEHLPEARILFGICVQGNDGTLGEAEQFRRDFDSKGSVAIVHFPEPLGIRPACVNAFALIDEPVDAYLMMDCDLNHQPEELPAFMEALRANTVVVGSRYCAGGAMVGMPMWKRFLSRAFNLVVSAALFLPVRDKTSGYRLIAAPAVPETASVVTGEGFEFYFEFLLLMWRQGVRVIEVPIHFTARTVGTSKMGIAGTSVGYLRSLARLARLRWGPTPRLPSVTADV
jgi:dolichol-phosphate mannosyltransferase